MKRFLLIPVLFMTSTFCQNGDSQWNTQALQRLMHEWDVKLEKMELHLQASMRRNEIDMWIIMSREFNVDPMLQMFGDYGISGWYGHRNAYIFFDTGNKLERTLIGTHQSGRMKDFFPTIISYGQEGLKPHLQKFINKRNPKKIAINRSRTVSMADGITVEMLKFLEDAIGEKYASRLTSAQPVIFDYINHRTPAFSPGITIYRRGVKGGIDDTENPLVIPGDLLHVDFGVRLMGLVTDQQHVAYVLHPDETEPPDGLQKLFQQSVIVGDLFAEELKAGNIGYEIKKTIESRAEKMGIQSSIYGHTQGNWVHGAGARVVFDWPDRYGDFAREPVRPTEFWSIEYSVQGKVPEWDNQMVRIPREEDAVIEEDGSKATFIMGPQKKLWLIESKK